MFEVFSGNLLGSEVRLDAVFERGVHKNLKKGKTCRQ
jgi:hypothetical protein